MLVTLTLGVVLMQEVEAPEDRCVVPDRLVFKEYASISGIVRNPPEDWADRTTLISEPGSDFWHTAARVDFDVRGSSFEEYVDHFTHSNGFRRRPGRWTFADAGPAIRVSPFTNRRLVGFGRFGDTYAVVNQHGVMTRLDASGAMIDTIDFGPVGGKVEVDPEGRAILCLDPDSCWYATTDRPGHRYHVNGLLYGFQHGMIWMHDQGEFMIDPLRPNEAPALWKPGVPIPGAPEFDLCALPLIRWSHDGVWHEAWTTISPSEERLLYDVVDGVLTVSDLDSLCIIQQDRVSSIQHTGVVHVRVMGAYALLYIWQRNAPSGGGHDLYHLDGNKLMTINGHQVRSVRMDIVGDTLFIATGHNNGSTGGLTSTSPLEIVDLLTGTSRHIEVSDWLGP